MPTKLSVRRTAMISATESKNETWLAAMIAGPVRGSCSPPSTRTRHRTWYSGVTSNRTNAYTGPNRLLGCGAAGATILNQAGSLRHGPGESAESHQSDRGTEATAAAPTTRVRPATSSGVRRCRLAVGGAGPQLVILSDRPIREEVIHAAVSHDAPGVELRNGVEPARGDRPHGRPAQTRRPSQVGNTTTVPPTLLSTSCSHTRPTDDALLATARVVGCQRTSGSGPVRRRCPNPESRRNSRSRPASASSILSVPRVAATRRCDVSD